MGQCSGVTPTADTYGGRPHCVYLFYCEPFWNVVTDTWHEDVAAALHQANFEFGLLRFYEFTPAG